jgi:hypothetical protein
MAKSKKSEDKVEARPIGEGKDPLAEGARLRNPSNTTGETHYEADNSELKAEEQAAKNRIDGKDADERAEKHNQEVAETQAADLESQQGLENNAGKSK